MPVGNKRPGAMLSRPISDPTLLQSLLGAPRKHAGQTETADPVGQASRLSLARTGETPVPPERPYEPG
jgi:hypothetical protein